MFDILVLLIIGFIALLLIYIVFKSQMALKKVIMFSETKLQIMRDDSHTMRVISQDLKEISGDFKRNMSAIKSQSSVFQCDSFESGKCNLCNGDGLKTGRCLLDEIKEIKLEKIELDKIELEKTKSQRMVTEK